MAAEFGSTGHTFNTVNPGPVQTDLVEMQRRQTPLENRMETADDIAQVMDFLEKEGSRCITE